jgi:hypothetical protein
VYHVIVSKDLKELCREVDEWRKDGAWLAGGVSIAAHVNEWGNLSLFYAQAIVKDDWDKDTLAALKEATEEDRISERLERIEAEALA